MRSGPGDCSSGLFLIANGFQLVSLLVTGAVIAVWT
jgi:hypothetical protein